MSSASPAIACRFPLIAPSGVLDPTVREVYTEIERELGFGIVPNIFRAMAIDPPYLTCYLGPLPRYRIARLIAAHSQGNDRYRGLGFQQK